MYPTIGWVSELDGFVHFVESLPFRFGIAAVHWFFPVERRVPSRHKVAVPIGDIAVAIGEYGIVRRVGTVAHDFLVRRISLGFRAQVRLRERFERLVHHFHGHPLLPSLVNDRTVVGPVQYHWFVSDIVAVAVGLQYLFPLYGKLFPPIAIGEYIAVEGYRFEVFVERVGLARRVHPSAVFIEPLVDEELAPGDGTVGIQAFLADHVHFGAEIKRSVRVDEQHGMP